MFAYDKRGVVFAMREGAEVLVHDGDTEGPLWRETLDGTIVGLGADSDRVVAVTELGTVSWFGALEGTLKRSATLPNGVIAAVVDLANDRIVAVGTDRITRLDGAVATQLADHSARAVAMRPDGTVLISTGEDQLVTFGLDGARTATTSPAPMRALAWHPDGFWVLGSTSKLYRWTGSGEAAHISSIPAESTLDFVACSAKAIAVAWDRDTVVTLAWPSKDTLGSLHYFERHVEGIDFGPWPWLGIAMDLGDGNKQNLEDREHGLHRSDTHPGREHHRWLVRHGGGTKPAAAPTATAPLASATQTQRNSRKLAVLIIAVVVAIAVVLVMR